MRRKFRRCRDRVVENGFDCKDVWVRGARLVHYDQRLLNKRRGAYHTARLPSAQVHPAHESATYIGAAGAQTYGRSEPLDWNSEHVSHTALGLDDARRGSILFKLASQAKNLHVDAAIENILMHARGLQQVLTA